MQKARRQAFHRSGIALRPLVGMWFQVQYPPLVGVLPIFRSRYLFAIGRQGVFSLAGWAPQIQTHFHVLSLTQVPAQTPSPVAYGTVTRCGRTFQNVRLRYKSSKCRSYNPTKTSLRGLGYSVFARRY
jgi:hypothetical protein